MNDFHLIFFGDSICFGQGISLYKGWIPRIAQHLGEIKGSSSIITTNTSVNGRTSRQALESMPYEVQSQSPDLLVTQFGMNDCNYWATDKGMPRVSKAVFKANLKEIVERGIHFGAKRVLLNTNHPTMRITEIFPFTNTTYNQSNLEYNEIIREVACEDERIILNDIEREFENRKIGYDTLSEYLLADYLHLSEKGHDLYFEVTLPKVKSTIFDILRK